MQRTYNSPPTNNRSVTYQRYTYTGGMPYWSSVYITIAFILTCIFLLLAV